MTQLNNLSELTTLYTGVSAMFCCCPLFALRKTMFFCQHNGPASKKKGK